MKKARYYVKRFDSVTFWVKDRKFGTIEAEARNQQDADAIAARLNAEDRELFG